jgi:hypothetical protein
MDEPRNKTLQSLICTDAAHADAWEAPCDTASRRSGAGCRRLSPSLTASSGTACKTCDQDSRPTRWRASGTESPLVSCVEALHVVQYSEREVSPCRLDGCGRLEVLEQCDGVRGVEFLGAKGHHAVPASPGTAVDTLSGDGLDDVLGGAARRRRDELPLVRGRRRARVLRGLDTQPPGGHHVRYDV